jgi:hypothetical protein
MSVGSFWGYLGIAVTATIVCLLWPLTSALSPADAWQVRAGAAAVSIIVCAWLAVASAGRAAVWVAISIGAAVIGVAFMLGHSNAATACVADYDGRPVIVGREFAPDALPYTTNNPGLSPTDRLLDAGGSPERIWTASSIRSCRFWLSWGGLAAVPFMALSAAALVSRARRRYLPRPTSAAPAVAAPGTAPVYDAFLSYRHTEPDRTYALEIVEALEHRGLRTAIDVRDFAANEHFLSEMERCIKQSRFVLCVITSEYVSSEHTSEEAIISKTLDLAERSRRLVPLVFERVELPVWLHGLVGIDFTPSATVDPFERLQRLVEPRVPVRGASGSA